jgi:hypothetical protein
MDQSVMFCACINQETDLLKLNSGHDSFYGVCGLNIGKRLVGDWNVLPCREL